MFNTLIGEKWTSIWKEHLFYLKWISIAVLCVQLINIFEMENFNYLCSLSKLECLSDDEI